MKCISFGAIGKRTTWRYSRMSGDCSKNVRTTRETSPIDVDEDNSVASIVKPLAASNAFALLV